MADSPDTEAGGSNPNEPAKTPNTKSSNRPKSSKYDWVSPVVLCALLLVLISATRVYIGGAEGVIFVWKGGFSFNDTVVNIADYANLTKEELAQHPALLTQMEDMDLLNQDFERPIRRKRIRKNSDNPEATQAPAP